MTGSGVLRLLLVAALAQDREPRVEVELERAQVYEGEAVRYVVRALDVTNADPPDLASFTDFSVATGGSTSLNSSSIQIRGGKMSRVDTVGVQYDFLLTPKRTGRLRIPAPLVRTTSGELRGEELALEVLSPDEQDFAYLFIEASPLAVYPLQPFTVKVRLFLKKLPAEYRKSDPISILFRLERPPVPLLRIPWVDLDEGLSAAPTDKWLGEHQVRGGRRGERSFGFAINERAGQLDPFFAIDPLFGGTRYTLFDLEGRPATASDVDGIAALTGRSDNYYVYELDREIVARRPGTFVFGPATLKASLIDAVTGGRVSLKEIFAVGRALHVTVKAPPEAGRPPGYTNGVGTFALEASVAPARGRVGDPLTFTIRVTGQGNLEDLLPPDLTQVAEVTAGFKLYEATAETKGGARLFTWSLRPLATTVKEVPAVPYAWFDPVREKFVAAATRPQPIEVVEAERLDPRTIVGDRAAATATPTSLAARTEGLFAEATDVRALRNERPSWRVHVAAAALLPLVTLGVGGFAGILRRRHADPRARRRRGAVVRARERLAQAQQCAARGETDAAAQALRSALVGLIADAADVPEAGLTPREAAEALATLGIDAALAQRCQAALEDWEGVKYGAAGAAVTTRVDEGRTLVDALASTLQRAGRLA